MNLNFLRDHLSPTFYEFIKHGYEIFCFAISKKFTKDMAEFIIALRFAWLAQWLRNKDREMIELELVYIKILKDNQAVLFR